MVRFLRDTSRTPNSNYLSFSLFPSNGMDNEC